MLQALPYHLKVRDFFKSQTKTWDYFAKNETKEEQLRYFKTELLKNTYKFDTESEPELYQKIEWIKEKLELANLPVTVYQAQYTDELNASIAYLQNEAHIVFSGQLIKLLDSDELTAVLAHELTHIKLFTVENGELEIADRVITAVANNISSEAVHIETARLFKLYTEIYCDRGSLLVLGHTAPVICSLVKVSTGLEKVNADSYIKQADEILSDANETITAGISHPENFIRAKAISLWHRQNEKAEEEISKMIEGVAKLDTLDLFQQKKTETLTRLFIQLFLKPKWFQGNITLSLARQYFADFVTNEKAVLTDDTIKGFEQLHTSVKDYFSYILLDFIFADPALEEIPAGWAFQFSEDLFLKDRFEPALKKEQKLTDKQFRQYKEKALKAYGGVKENETEQVYED